MRKIALGLLLTLGACASQPQIALQAPISITNPSAAPIPGASAQGPQDPLSQLASFTLSDLQAASADAHAQVPPDQTAYQCYDYLIGVLPMIQAPSGATVGAIVAFQKLRDLQNGVAGGTLKSLNLACAPLVIDVQTTINKLILLGTGAAVTGGTMVPIAGALLQ